MRRLAAVLLIALPLLSVAAASVAAVAAAGNGYARLPGAMFRTALKLSLIHI